MHFAASVSSVAPFAVARKCRSTRRGAVAVRAAATPFYHKGKPALSGVLSVPKAEEAKFDAMWKSHAKWMSETHLIGPNAAEDDEGHPRMLEYYVSKGDEMKDPMAEGAHMPVFPIPRPLEVPQKDILKYYNVIFTCTFL